MAGPYADPGDVADLDAVCSVHIIINVKSIRPFPAALGDSRASRRPAKIHNDLLAEKPDPAESNSALKRSFVTLSELFLLTPSYPRSAHQ